MNIFQLADNDQSVYFLGFIFGSVGNVLAPAGSGGTLTIGIIGTMLKVLNITALTIGVLMVVYITVVGVLATAHEGQFFGKDWSGLWVPIKTVLGIVALFPTGSGYSIIQILIMWIVIQGVAAADTMWTTVLNYVSYMGSPYATISVPTTSIDGPMRYLFQGMICYANSAYHSDYPSATDPLYYCNSNNPNAAVCSSGVVTSIPKDCVGGGNCVYQMGPNGNCGQLTYCSTATDCAPADPNKPNDPDSGPNSLKCLTCKAQQTAVQSIVTYYANLASNYVAADNTYLTFWGSGVKAGGNFIQQFCSDHGIGGNDCCYQSPANRAAAGGVENCSKKAESLFTSIPPFDPKTNSTNASADAVNLLYWPYVIKPLMTNGNTNPDVLKIVKKLYADAIAGAFTTWLATQPTNLSGWQTEAQSKGWLVAGAYYYTMAGENSDNQKMVMPTFTYSGSDPYGSGTTMSQFRNNYTAAGTLLTAINDASATEKSNFAAATGGSNIGMLGNGLTSSVGDFLYVFQGAISGDVPGQITTNSLANLQHMGTAFLYIADAAFLYFLVASTILLSTIGWSALVFGSGPLNPMTPAMVGVVIIILPIVLAIVGFLYAAGALLAVYTPLIPYIIFTMGAIGWMIGVIEAMVAGPLIALGILSPGKGGHELLGKAEPALMGMFGLFLRPTLMVVGLVVAMMLSAAAVTMVNITFNGVVGQIGSWHMTPSLAFFFCAAYIGLILAVLNKCFSVIHLLPDKVLSWIGGQHAPGGGHGEAGEALKGAEAKTTAAGAGAGSMAASGAKPITEAGGQKARDMVGSAAGKAPKSDYSMKGSQMLDTTDSTNQSDTAKAAKPAAGDQGGGDNKPK